MRAQRYPLKLPVQYRRVGETEWHAGITENISDSGAVIRTDEAVPPSTRVVIVIALPSSAALPGGRLTGEGTVVRRVRSSARTFAVTVTGYTLARPENVLDSLIT